MKHILSIILVIAISYSTFFYISIFDFQGQTFYNSSDKLWAHRILDPQKIEKISSHFKGFEIDVFYSSNDNCFDVKHHGESNGMTLTKYFSKIDDVSSYKYWIDFKNLKKSNIDSSMVLMKKITDQFNLQNDIIIESKDIQLLSNFKSLGISISYWVPAFHVFKSILNINKVKEDLIKFSPNAISMPFSSVQFYSNKFPNYPIHCWTNNLTDEKDKLTIQKIVSVKEVKIVLTDFKTNFLK